MEEETRMITPSIFVPNPDEALEAWNQYQIICEKLLNDSDYVAIRGKKHRKRTGWAKLRRAFNITTEIINASWEALSEDDFGYNVTIRATFSDGRYEDGDGYCDSGEMRNSNILPTRHNVRSKAITRAKNRATADLIGSGEVSAEEFIDDEQPTEKKATSQKGKSQSNNNKAKLERPMTPKQVLKAAQMKAAKETNQATAAQCQYAVTSLSKACGNNDDTRHAISEYLFGKASSAEWTSGECSFIIDWIGANSTNNYIPTREAVQEVMAIIDVIYEAVEMNQTPQDEEIPF